LICIVRKIVIPEINMVIETIKIKISDICEVTNMHNLRDVDKQHSIFASTQMNMQSKSQIKFSKSKKQSKK
jgi:hypothetical protein